jgi:hypothetical protein
MKYVLFQSLQAPEVVKFHGIMFDDAFTHSEVARGTRGTHREMELVPFGAGFVDTLTWATSGLSESMELMSNADDGLYLWGGSAVAHLSPSTIRVLFAMWQANLEDADRG